MKKLIIKEASLVLGSGCKKYLRRYHRALGDDNWWAATANLALYSDCVYSKQ